MTEKQWPTAEGGEPVDYHIDEICNLVDTPENRAFFDALQQRLSERDENKSPEPDAHANEPLAKLLTAPETSTPPPPPPEGMAWCKICGQLVEATDENSIPGIGWMHPKGTCKAPELTSIYGTGDAVKPKTNPRQCGP